MTVTRRFKLVCAAVLFGSVFLLACGVGSLAWFHFGNPTNTCAS